MNYGKKKRLFLSIDIPEVLRERLVDLLKNFEHSSLKFTSEKNLHITLHFIGPVDAPHVDELKRKIRGVSKKYPRFKLETESLKIIRKRGKPVMIWLTFLKSQGFKDLASALSAELPGGGKKEQIPHVTVARVKDIWTPPSALPFIRNLTIDVNEFFLMESFTGGKESVYLKIESFSLE